MESPTQKIEEGLHDAPSGPLPMASPEPGKDLDSTSHHKNVSASAAAIAPRQLIAPSSPEKERSTSNEPSWFGYCTRTWFKLTQWLHQGISAFVLTLSLSAARNPKATIGFVVLLSFGVMATGFFTNFHVELSEEKMFASSGSRAQRHMDFVHSVGFPLAQARAVFLLVHAEGDNALTYDGVDRLFRALDAVRNMETYDGFCGSDGCGTGGVVKWWNSNTTLFHQQTEESDEITRQTLSNQTLPTGTLTRHEFSMGYPEKNDEGNLTSALSMISTIDLPMQGHNGRRAINFEIEVIDVLNDLRDQFEQEPNNPYRLEFSAQRSYNDELMRAIARDMPLLPFVFIVMTLFTCSIFWRRHKVQSRTLLGLGSVFTIAMSLMSGFGLAFLIGFPFTSMTQLLPFVIFGVGLDDTFIITGAYFRTDPRKDTIERVEETMEEVGNSISLTTITTTAAFLLGCISSIPSIRWLCLYAFPTIFIDFIYQITCFIAILVLDEQRIQSKRRDVCICFVVEDSEEDTLVTQPAPNRPRLKTQDEDESDSHSYLTQQQSTPPSTPVEDSQRTNNHEQSSLKMEAKAPLPDRFMAWYADRLLHPKVKIFVVVAFIAFLAGCAYSATMLEQSFEMKEFLPDGSYAVSFLTALQTYRRSTVRLGAYFRHVNQSALEVQEEMVSFLEDLVALPQFQVDPEICWVNDLHKLRTGDFDDNDIVAAFQDYSWILHDNSTTFEEKLKLILDIPQVGPLYDRDIVLDENDNIVASRCWLTVSNLDLNKVEQQMQILKDMRSVMKHHPANENKDDFAFFIWDGIFFIWDFFLVAVRELTFTTVSGVVAVSVIGFFLIPHWTASFFVAPLIAVLYVDLLGTIQFAGLHINPITYVCLVISIGLLVDFLMHFLLRFYESTELTREEKVKDALRTMGASILVGGASTLLGVLPLAFSTSAIMRTVFTAFFAMICLGVGHGLILLPVLLSYLGPEVCVRANHTGRPQEAQQLQAGTVKWEEPREIEQVMSGSTIDVDAYAGVDNGGQALVLLGSRTSLDVDRLVEPPTSSMPSSLDILKPDTVSPYPSFDQDTSTPPAASNSVDAGRNQSSVDEGLFGILRTTSSASIEV